MNYNIPLDIISDILLRLPIKSIGRSKCVSRSWLSLISESHFVKNLVHRALSNSSDDDDRIIVCDFTKTMLTNPSQLKPPNDFHGELVDSGLPHRHLDASSYRRVVGSCHGLLVVIVSGEHLLLDNAIFVCNPCTGEHRELPKLNNIATSYDTVFGGIGYDSYSDDYKVLICANLFSLKTNSWKTLTNIPCDYHAFDIFGLFFDGSLYWLGRHNSTKLAILTFDLDTEQYLESPQPLLPQAPDGLHYENLFVMGTSLSIFLYGLLQSEHEVWVMKKQGDESVWTKSFVIVYGHCDYYVRPVCLLKSGELLLHVDDALVVLYNLMDGTHMEIIPEGYPIYCVYGYIESLVSPYRVHETGLGEQ